LKILKVITITAVLSVGAMAQTVLNDSRNAKTEPLVVKTASVESSYKSFVATAYSLRGRMANGQNVHLGAIAADPRVLPLGTVVFIEGLGTYTVKDTGGAIKGNRIDIWMPTKAMTFGRRTVKLKIVSKPVKRIKI